MRSTGKLLYVSLLIAGAMLAQDGPPPGGGPGGPGGHEGFRGFGMGGPVVTGAPFSATRTETRQETLTDGNQISQTHTAKLYRDAEGRTRVETTVTDRSGATKTMITIVDPVAGFIAHLNPADTTAVKQNIPAHKSGSGHNPPTAPTDENGVQVVKTDLGSSTISGLAVTGTKTVTTIDAGTMGNSEAIVDTREVWTSTALKIAVKSTSTDPRRGTSSMLLSDVSQAAPDASLFVIPSSYTVKEGHFHGGPGGGGPPPGE